MAEFGSGPSLTQDLDFTVTTTGDIETVSGSDELQKDIAVQLLIELGDLIGRPQYENTVARITSRTRETLNNDPRIERVLAVDVAMLQSNNGAEIITSVETDNGEQELVFTL